jgi:hypothetical protein
MSKYKKIKDYEGYAENPFVEKAIQDVKIIRKTQVVRAHDRGEVQMIVNDGGEITGHTAFMRYIEVEESQFAKLYLSQFEHFWDLPKSAIRVFGYVLTRLVPKKDEFYFDMEECLKYTKYSTEKSVFEGLAALIETGIVARTTKHYKYFINPMVVFNGDRVSFTKTFIKKKQGNNPNQLDMFGEPIQLKE